MRHITSPVYLRQLQVSAAVCEIYAYLIVPWRGITFLACRWVLGCECSTVVHLYMCYGVYRSTSKLLLLDPVGGLRLPSCI